MKRLSNLLAAAVFVLLFTGTIMALDKIIGHPARYVEHTS